MQITSINLRSQNQLAKRERLACNARPVNARDSCQRKISRLEDAFTVKSHMAADNNKTALTKRPLPSHSRTKRVATWCDKSMSKFDDCLENSDFRHLKKESLH